MYSRLTKEDLDNIIQGIKNAAEKVRKTGAKMIELQ